MTLSDLSVFGIPGYGEEPPKQLSIVKPLPAYSDFEPLYTKLLNMKATQKTVLRYLAGLGATIKESKGASIKDPEIVGLTWEHIDQMKATIAEKEAKAAEKKQKKGKAQPEPASEAEEGPSAQEQPIDQPEAPPEPPAKEKQSKPWTMEKRAKEWQRLQQKLEKKGYEKDDLTGMATAYADELPALLPEHFDQLAATIEGLEDVSPSALEKQRKEREKKEAAEFMQGCEDRITALLNSEIVNPFNQNKYTVKQVLRNLAATMSLAETRSNEYVADMNQLNADEQGWKQCYGAHLNYELVREFERRQRTDANGEIYYRPATIKLGWISAKRSPVKGGPTCTDKNSFQIWVNELAADPKKLEAFLSSLTQEQQTKVANCFQRSISIDYRACEIAVNAGVKFPEWTIKDPDPIGEPKLYFSRPRATTPGESQTEEEEE